MRVAVFIDAGYLYAQGSKALTGNLAPTRRTDIQLDQSALISRILATTAEKAGSVELLRIYWYDGLIKGRLTDEQRSLADTDNVKLRLGVVSGAGQQKGVDTLIVTDLVDLARNQAISDAVLFSGDQDLVIGVQIAQSYGVRVHLLGIEPSRSSQSISLLQEADTTTEWSKEELSAFLKVRPGVDDQTSVSIGIETNQTPGSGEPGDNLETAVDGFVSSLSVDDMKEIADLGETVMIPQRYDRRLLAICGRAIAGTLGYDEKRQMRTYFRAAVRARLEEM